MICTQRGRRGYQHPARPRPDIIMSCHYISLHNKRDGGRQLMSSSSFLSRSPGLLGLARIWRRLHDDDDDEVDVTATSMSSEKRHDAAAAAAESMKLPIVFLCKRWRWPTTLGRHVNEHAPSDTDVDIATTTTSTYAK